MRIWWELISIEYNEIDFSMRQRVSMRFLRGILIISNVPFSEKTDSVLYLNYFEYTFKTKPSRSNFHMKEENSQYPHRKLNSELHSALSRNSKLVILKLSPHLMTLQKQFFFFYAPENVLGAIRFYFIQKQESNKMLYQGTTV